MARHKEPGEGQGTSIAKHKEDHLQIEIKRLRGAGERSQVWGGMESGFFKRALCLGNWGATLRESWQTGPQNGVGKLVVGGERLARTRKERKDRAGR